MKTLDIIGYLAAAGTTGAWLPQVLKTIKSRSAEDFSWAYLAVFATGVALWLAYGIGKKEMPIMLANAVTLALVVVVGVVKLREK
jgi:MtN3 and saliva related transmembrane protein